IPENDGPIPVSNFSPVERLAVNMKQILDLTNSRKTLRPSVFSGTSHQTVGFFQLFLSFESQLLNHCMYVTYLPPPPLPPTDGSGGWSSDGCSVHNTTKDNVTVCGCNHLTSFAILLLTDPLHATILTFITYIGCGISAIFLSITILTYLAFESAVHMYVALVKVFNSHMSHYMLRLSFAGWGIPMIVVIVVIAVDKDNYGLISYGRFPDGTSDDFCWLKNDIAFYVAVVAYFCVIFLFNCVMFVVVLVQLCRVKRQNPHNTQHRTTIQEVRSMVGITILLGLTWGFAFFAWGPVNLAFMYLFAIFNSLQGEFDFRRFFVLNKSVSSTVLTSGLV
uniref:Si:dkey-259j3.5 n=1 Tax=Cynoglossus semilaevis TaxID=244447 RepID=A0A3P8VHZ5_CYNSE